MIAAKRLPGGTRRSTCLRPLTNPLRSFFYNREETQPPPRAVAGLIGAARIEAPAGVPHSERSYRSIFISDIYFGTRGCSADHLLYFLARTKSEHLYIVGDLVVGQRQRRSWDST